MPTGVSANPHHAAARSHAAAGRWALALSEAQAALGTVDDPAARAELIDIAHNAHARLVPAGSGGLAGRLVVFGWLGAALALVLFTGWLAAAGSSIFPAAPIPTPTPVRVTPTRVATSPPVAIPTRAPTRQPARIAPVVPTAVPTLASLPPTATPIAPTALYVAHTNGEGVFLRRTPNLDDKLNAWPEGTRMEVLGEPKHEGGLTWAVVRAPDGQHGFLPAEYLDPRPPTPTPVPTATSTPTRTPTRPPSPTATRTPTPLPIPGLGAEAAVRKFYSAIAARDFASAWALLSPRFQAKQSYNSWVDGYKTTRSVQLRSLTVKDQSSTTATVAVTVDAVDDLGGRLVPSTFQGVWELVLTNGAWRLDVGKIEQVT